MFEDKYIQAVRTLLEFIGEDPRREGLQDTPRRFLKAWREHWGKGYAMKEDPLVKTFLLEYESGVIVVDKIKVHSTCEHHLAPIVGYAKFAYEPRDKIAGLSKINRLVDKFSRRLQVQERLGEQIVEAFYNSALKPKACAVVISAEHFCVKTRGIQDVSSFTTTYASRGEFSDGFKLKGD